MADTTVLLGSQNGLETRHIGVYVTDGFADLCVAGSLEAFTAANANLGRASYRAALISADGSDVTSVSGLAMRSTTGSRVQLDTLIVIGGASRVIHPKDVAFVRNHARVARRTLALNHGAFLLAATGLLDGRRVTTHETSTEALRRAYPAVHVEADRIFVNDGPYWTCAGRTAALDLAIALVEDDHGQGLAQSVAQSLLVHHRRHGGQSQRSEMLAFGKPADAVSKALAYAKANLDAALSVDELASIAALSPRQFRRAFRSQTGETPARAVERLRVEAAKARVETTSESIEAIGASVGFADPERMRRAFIRRFGASAQQLRRNARDSRGSQRTESQREEVVDSGRLSGDAD